MRTRRDLFRVAAVLAGILAASTLGSQTRPGAVPVLAPEHDDVRLTHFPDAIAPLGRLEALPTRVVASRRSGVETMVTVERTSTHVYLLFVPRDHEGFPVYAAGTYILRRRRSDGAIDQLKIFLRSDPGFFVRVWPEGEGRSTMSVFLAGHQLHRGVQVPLSIESLLQEPLSRLLQVTAARVDWQLFVHPAGDPGYRVVADTAARARSMLHTLPDAEDGAMDEHGNLVFIESLVLQDQQPGFNCSGFAKWIVDGVYMALYGRYLAIEPLKTKHLDLRGHRWSAPREDDRDPYFGLDWTRNLAVALLSAGEGDGTVHPEAADVREVQYVTYVEDVGYPVERLPQIMYLLARSEPGYFYLASFSREFGAEPRLRQHVHVAVLFPYFDSLGAFHVDVMERNVETSLESLDRRYRSDWVHLVRIKAHPAFRPPQVRS